MIRALPRVALQLWIVLFIVFFGAEVIHLEPGLRILTQLLYGVPLAMWAIWRLRGPADRLDWAVLGLLVLYAVVCLFSRDRTESLGTLGLATSYGAWFMLMRRADPWELRKPIVLAATTGLAITLTFNAYLLVQEKLAWYAAVGAAPFEGLMTFPWESVNALPILVLIAIAFVALLEASWVRNTLATVIALSAIVVVPISMGRAGWTGLAVAALLIAMGRVPRPRRGQVGAGLAVAGVLGLLVIGPRVLTALGESGRLLLWEQGATMVRSTPIIGSGPGVYSWVRLEFAPAGADLVAVRLLHNVPLQTMVDGGLILLAGVGAVLLVWGMTVASHTRGWTWRERATAAAVIGFLLALVLDDFSYLPAITALALTLAAFLAPAAARPAGWLAPAILAIVAAVALPNVIGVDLARSAAQSGRTALVGGDHADAMAAFEMATRFHPEHGGYWLGLGMATAYAGDEEASVDAYERAFAAAPGDPRAYAALAALDPEADAISLLRKASDRTLGDATWALNLGLALAADGQADEATYAWAHTVVLRPELLRMLPYDVTGISMDAVAEEALMAIHAELRPGPAENLATLWDLALAMDDLPDDAGIAWRAVDAARHDDHAAARDLADAAIAEVPYDPRPYRALAAAAAFACDPDLEQGALELERATGKQYTPIQPEPFIRREFVYREAGLGPSQPPGSNGIEVERWPWSLVDRPTGCDS